MGMEFSTAMLYTGKRDKVCYPAKFCFLMSLKTELALSGGSEG